MRLADLMSYDLEEESSVVRAPPMPIEGIRRVASVALRSASTTFVPGLVNVESFLQRSGQSLYDGRTSFFDILMAVFPRGKSLSVSRAAIKDADQQKASAILLSWAATCERWCAEYEELRKLHSSADRSSVYAITRTDAFRTASTTALDAAAGKKPFQSGAAYQAFADMDAILTEVVAFKLPGADALVDLTYQILLMRPLVWHAELTPGASFVDPVVIAGVANASFTTPWCLAYRAVTNEYTTHAALADKRPVDAALASVVYVDGAALKARDIFLMAITQLSNESKKVYDGTSKNPRPRRGICPAGTEYTVELFGVRVTDKALDSALRAAIRKYGKINDVQIKCSPGDFTFDAIPLDESSLW